MLGLFVGDVDPKFVKKYANLSKIIKETFANYIDYIKNGEFPKEEHLYSIEGEDLEKIQNYSNNFKSN